MANEQTFTIISKTKSGVLSYPNNAHANRPVSWVEEQPRRHITYKNVRDVHGQQKYGHKKKHRSHEDTLLRTMMHIGPMWQGTI